MTTFLDTNYPTAGFGKSQQICYLGVKKLSPPSETQCHQNVIFVWYSLSMLSKVFSAALVGINAQLVAVELDIASQGLPSFTIVGLGDRAIIEARERVRAALRNSGADYPIKRMTVNLAPADLPKEGPSFDLPIAVSILKASQQITTDLSHTLIIGELSLDGSICPVPGVLAVVLCAKTKGFQRVIVPESNVQEATLIEGVEVYGFSHLIELCDFLNGRSTRGPQRPQNIATPTPHFEVDFQSIKGQEQAKRALMIAAAGGHNLLLYGPPGTGKTLLSKALVSIMPPLSAEEMIEVTQIHSIKKPLSQLILQRPFRSPHHTSSFQGIIGGNQPGEISLAHRGVLFLDEIAEFPRNTLEALRQPLEDRSITISRTTGNTTFPSHFILLAAQNPCPCGYATSTKKRCTCSVAQIHTYQRKLSGPILDRIDLFVDVPEVSLEKLLEKKIGDSSAALRAKVMRAHQRQKDRFGGINSEMTNQQVKEYCLLTAGGVTLLKEAMTTFNLSARGYYRVLKTARTIADLEESQSIKEEHIAEVLQFRAKENPVPM